jgi:O-antigen/teichoic acid export membrane protein
LAELRPVEARTEVQRERDAVRHWLVRLLERGFPRCRTSAWAGTSGHYTVAWTISSTPIEKIGNLVTNITPAFFSAIQCDKAELRRYLLRLTEALSYVTVPASIGIALVADYLVPVLLGPKWMGVIGPLRLLGLLMAFRSGTILPSRVLTAVRETAFVMWMTIATAIALPLAFLVGSRWGTNGIAAAWIIVYPPLTLPLYCRTFRKIEMTAKEYLSSIMPALGASLAMTVAVMLIRFMLPGGWPLPVRFGALVAIGALSYAGALLAFYRERFMRLFRSLRGLQAHQTEIPQTAVVNAGLD